MEGVDHFVNEARAYCDFVRQAASLALPERLAAARVRLLALYTAALPLELPDDTDNIVAADPEPVRDWPGFGELDSYWEIFDPYELAEPLGGSLTDDMIDCYRDVQRGLGLWDAGHHQAAIWQWRFHFDIHWGDHAIDALRALHRACKRYLNASDLQSETT